MTTVAIVPQQKECSDSPLKTFQHAFEYVKEMGDGTEVWRCHFCGAETHNADDANRLLWSQLEIWTCSDCGELFDRNGQCECPPDMASAADFLTDIVANRPVPKLTEGEQKAEAWLTDMCETYDATIQRRKEPHTDRCVWTITIPRTPRSWLIYRSAHTESLRVHTLNSYRKFLTV